MKRLVALAIPICLILGAAGLLANTYLRTERFLTQEDDLVRASSRMPKDTVPAAEEELAKDTELASYEKIYQRKLFTRPEVETPAAPSAQVETEVEPEEEKIELVLTGIAQIGDNFLAAIKNTASGETKFMRIGEEVAGYTILEIGPVSAKLEDTKGEIITLSLERK